MHLEIEKTGKPEELQAYGLIAPALNRDPLDGDETMREITDIVDRAALLAANGVCTVCEASPRAALLAAIEWTSKYEQWASRYIPEPDKNMARPLWGSMFVQDGSGAFLVAVSPSSVQWVLTAPERASTASDVLLDLTAAYRRRSET